MEGAGKGNDRYGMAIGFQRPNRASNGYVGAALVTMCKAVKAKGGGRDAAGLAEDVLGAGGIA